MTQTHLTQTRDEIETDGEAVYDGDELLGHVREWRSFWHWRPAGEPWFTMDRKEATRRDAEFELKRAARKAEFGYSA